VGIAGMVVWTLTAGVGIYLLAVGIAAQRADERIPRAPAQNGVTAVVGSAALPLVLRGQQAAGERPDTTRSAPDGSPLLEFAHPALALLGLTFWIFYVMTGYRTFAWIAFGVVVATVTAGLSWETVRRRTARRRAGSDRGHGPRFPAHLIMLHGAAAACTFALVVITAVVAR
jgi:heme exporter protein D